jgi:hypothetical protein
VRYVWSHEGETHQGSTSLHDERAEFTDTWHQPQVMICHRLDSAWGLFQVQGEYGAESDWRWRIAHCQRTPTNELVLQMTNVAPWGEEARAVRMVWSRDGWIVRRQVMGLPTYGNCGGGTRRIVACSNA